MKTVLKVFGIILLICSLVRLVTLSADSWSDNIEAIAMCVFLGLIGFVVCVFVSTLGWKKEQEDQDRADLMAIQRKNIRDRARLHED